MLSLLLIQIVMLRRQTKFQSELGSVTAELAMAMPAVAMVIAITISAFALQVERMKLVEVAAMAARASARGETEENIRALIAEMTAPVLQEQIRSEFEVRENVSCAVLTCSFEIPALGAGLFELSEQQCARKLGL